MSKIVQRNRANLAAGNAYTGPVGEVTPIVGDAQQLRLHDGQTPGGAVFLNQHDNDARYQGADAALTSLAGLSTAGILQFNGVSTLSTRAGAQVSGVLDISGQVGAFTNPVNYFIDGIYWIAGGSPAKVTLPAAATIANYTTIHFKSLNGGSYIAATSNTEYIDNVPGPNRYIYIPYFETISFFAYVGRWYTLQRGARKVGQVVDNFDLGFIENDGLLQLNGQAVSRLFYANLFLKYGTGYGAGDGNTTFNLPNLNYGVRVGAGTLAVGSTGGEVSHTLQSAELPATGVRINDPGHNHAVSDPGHAHTYSDPGHAHSLSINSGVESNQHIHTVTTTLGQRDLGNGTAFIAANFSDNNAGRYGTDGETSQHLHNVSGTTAASVIGVTIQAVGTGIANQAAGTNITASVQGSGAAHNNMPPYMAANMMVQA